MGREEGFENGRVNVAKCQGPRGVLMDASENVYFADNGSHRIRKISKEGKFHFGCAVEMTFI
jgi:hypothetical protein